MKITKLFITVLILFLVFGACTNSNQNSKKNIASEKQTPNIIYILADDLGYGDLSCYGQTNFSTPNIDKLAESGMKFTQHYSGCTVCAPSRSALLTGQHTGHTFIRGNKEIQPEGQHPLEAKAVTMAEVLQKAGYVTGAFGKWGLGYPGSEGDPNNQGFDEFFGFNCQRMGHNYYPYHLWHNQEKIVLKGNEGKQTGEYGPDVIHNRAIKFLEDNKDKPFFMYYPSIIPHAELLAPEKYMDKYRGKFLPELKYIGVDDGENYRLGPYGSQPESHATFAAMVNILDDEVGEIVAKLKELGIYENTLIIFTSDNGPHMEGGADPDYFDSNGILKGYKRDLYEGGIRIPMIAVWDGKIKPGTETDHISAFWDVFPTVAEITGIETLENIDGISFLPTLLGQEQKPHDYLYWEFHERGGRKALRKGDCKLVNYNVLKPELTTIELYNLIDDPGEENNVAHAHPKIVAELIELMKSARTESEIFLFESPTIIK
ncbi:MAG: arylsulfatase [Prolixibacteraceae bacterium]|jgi:arylsulfatase A|nr:arylsulfatase [Prolixibacteraceae bacterium]MBT6764229.1 arylsulfatase [Prolixibacteraceae bacterium]MBT6997137.1 arylsulfatase [Prolixibacteraceae bacterium]MBT7393330.1 arylsulfatase [Prolixibacteraceae bacterium]